MPRPKRDPQGYLDFLPSNHALTNKFCSKYQRISDILDACPEILDCVHRDIKKSLDQLNKTMNDYRFRYTSENILRMLLVQTIEGLSLREVVVRIEDSRYLPVFTRLGNRPMVSVAQLDRFKNAITPETWKSVNQQLARYAVEKELISGEELRFDTTAVETNIHFPTDSGLLYDCYRVLGRHLEQLRELDPQAVGEKRLRRKDVKRHYAKIARKAGKKQQSPEMLKPLYSRLIADVEGICAWTHETLNRLGHRGSADLFVAEQIRVLEDRLRHYVGLAERVLWQTRQRVIELTPVPSEQKIYSIHEPHTEMLIRGKAGKNIEFGHMIGFQQVRAKFITDFDVYEHKPVEYQILVPALESHRELFGSYPEGITADKGYWENSQAREELTRKVPTVAIAKKGKRTDSETEREHSETFSALQRFRAGIEGSISYLKRCFRLARCFNKGWRGFASTVSLSIVAHNLVTLSTLLC